jgi:hypothetical protein
VSQGLVGPGAREHLADALTMVHAMGRKWTRPHIRSTKSSCNARPDHTSSNVRFRSNSARISAAQVNERAISSHSVSLPAAG